MNMKLSVMLVVASCVLAGNASCADWKFYGGSKAVPETEELLFYDLKSITNTNNSIKIWTKSILSDEIKKGMNNKSVIEQSKAKIASGYSAPITKLFPKAISAVYFEEIANDPAIKSKTEILYQIVCDEKKSRRISQMSFNKDGALDKRFGINNWEGIESGSNTDNLAKIICGSK